MSHDRTGENGLDRAKTSHVLKIPTVLDGPYWVQHLQSGNREGSAPPKQRPKRLELTRIR